MAKGLARRSSLLRIHKIDELLRLAEPPSLEMLSVELEVSPRTLARDLDLMRSALKAPIFYDRKAKGYRYESKDYRLPAIRMTEGELVSLFIAEEAVRQYQGTPFGPDIESAFRKIAEALPDEVTVDFSWLGKAVSFRPGSVRRQEIATFKEITAAIRERRTLKIRYHSFSSETVSWRCVDPYHLANVQGDWYLIGRCHRRKEARIFLCARILEIESTDERFACEEGFDAATFLAGAFSIQKASGPPRRATIRFSAGAARYVRERVWHPSQKIEDHDDGSITLTLTVECHDELKRWVLSWGPSAEVISPRSLRQAMADDSRAMAANHEGKAREPARSRTTQKNSRKKSP